jgi:hypothetical protein
VPTEGSEDELLDDPPALSQAWSLQAYASGTRVRSIVFGSLILGTVGAGVAGYLYVDHLQEEQAKVVPSYDVAPDSVEAEDRILYWTDGPARLGLYRQAPGVRVVVLPDRIVQLAEGYDHAQIKVEVREGKTIKLTVLTGRVVQQEREPEESTPAAPAKAQ